MPRIAELLDADTDAPLLVPNAEGEYRLAVEVCDRWGRCDVAETVALVGEVAQRAGARSFGAVQNRTTNLFSSRIVSSEVSSASAMLARRA